VAYVGAGLGPACGSRAAAELPDCGSAPPAHGTIWQYVPASGASSCLAVPTNFNPSAYFATITGSGSETTLVFGAGGNSYDYRWQPTHGFYRLVDGILTPPTPDIDVYATANHVSASGGVVYFIHEDNLANGINVSGLGTYQTNGEWNVFPSVSFAGPQGDDGVAAMSHGAWFTAASVCSTPGHTWHGICLGRARYLSAWGVVPRLNLPAITVGTGAGFSPLNVHSGPYHSESDNQSVCVTHSPPPESHLIFTVTGKSQGTCPITISDKSGRSVPLITMVTTPAPK
jgi:hypothetical protein